MNPWVLLFPSPDAHVPDALVAPVWLLVNGLAWTAAWRWARRFFPQDSYLELVGHTLVLVWGCIVAVATLLGAVGWLSGPILLLGVAAVALAALSTAPPPAGSVPLGSGEALWLTAWVMLLGFWVGHVITGGLLKFPTDWDSLAYHIPLVDQWLQAHSLWVTDCANWANPGNNELLGLWAVGCFSGDFLIALNNLPAAVLFACSAVAVGTRIGLPRPLAHLGGFALVGHFVVLSQLVNAENDVAVAAGFFAALAYAFRDTENPNSGTLLLGAVSLGLLVGVKYYALGYAALVLGVWILLAAVGGVRPAARVLAVGTGGLCALGGFWYLRNLLLTGSPLYPRQLFTHPDVLTQIYPDVAHTSFFGNNRPDLIGLYVQAIWQMTGPCQFAGFVLLPLSLAWLLISAGAFAVRGHDSRQAWVRLAVILLLVGTGLLLGMTPFAVEDDPGTLNQMHWHYCPVRYGLCFLSVATLAGLLVLRDLLYANRQATGVRFAACTVLAGAVLIQFLWTDRRLAVDRIDAGLTAVNFVLGCLIWRLLGLQGPRLRRWLAPALVGAALLLVAWLGEGLSEHWHRQFVAHYDRQLGGGALHWIGQNHTGPVAVCVLDERCYPYLGSRREHRVYQPTYVPSAEWFVEVLRQKRVTLVVGKWHRPSAGWRRFLGLEECLARHSDRFRRTYEANGVGVLGLAHPPDSD